MATLQKSKVGDGSSPSMAAVAASDDKGSRGHVLAAAAFVAFGAFVITFGTSVNALPPPEGARSPVLFSSERYLPEFKTSQALTLCLAAVSFALAQRFLFGRGSKSSAMAYVTKEASALVASAAPPSGSGGAASGLEVLDGARALAMLLVVCFHSFSTPLSSGDPALGRADFFRLWANPGLMAPFKHGDLLGVEAFLVASGIVTFRSMLKSSGSRPAAAGASKGQAPAPAPGAAPRSLWGRAVPVAVELKSYVWQRWSRLAPPIFATVALYALLEPSSAKACTDEQNWISIGLFLNNRADHWTTCCFHTWYCALQMQLYLVGWPAMLLIRGLARRHEQRRSDAKRAAWRRQRSGKELVPKQEDLAAQQQLRPRGFLAVEELDAEAQGEPTATATAAPRPVTWEAAAAWSLLLAMAAGCIYVRVTTSAADFGLVSQTLLLRGTAFVVGLGVALALHFSPPSSSASAATETKRSLALACGARALDFLAIAVFTAAAIWGSQDESGDRAFANIILSDPYAPALGAVSSAAAEAAVKAASGLPTTALGELFRVLMPPALDVSMGWLVCAMAQGRLQLPAALLRWGIWRPLSTISYSCFLVQFLAINRVFVGFWASSDSSNGLVQPSPFMPRPGDGLEVVALRASAFLLASVAATLTVGLLFYLLVEAPLRDLCRLAVSSKANAASPSAPSAPTSASPPTSASAPEPAGALLAVLPPAPSAAAAAPSAAAGAGAGAGSAAGLRAAPAGGGSLLRDAAQTLGAASVGAGVLCAWSLVLGLSASS